MIFPSNVCESLCAGRGWCKTAGLFVLLYKVDRVKLRFIIATFTFSYRAWFSKVGVVFHWPQWVFLGGWECFKQRGACTLHCQPKYSHQQVMPFHIFQLVTPCLVPFNSFCLSWSGYFAVSGPLPSACALGLSTADRTFLSFQNLNPSMCLERATYTGIFSIKMFTESLN